MIVCMYACMCQNDFINLIIISYENNFYLFFLFMQIHHTAT